MKKESIDIKKFRSAIHNKRIEWRKHILQRMAERNIKQSAVIKVLLNGECIEEYPDDSPYPSVLFFGLSEKTPIHVVASFDKVNSIVYIITAYKPSFKVFDVDYRKRRKS